MNCASCSTDGRVLRLLIRELPPCPSFKNAKRVSGQKLITDKRVKAWMDRAILDIECQLRSISRTIGGETWTEDWQRRWIASSVPLDDCRQVIVEESVKAGGLKVDLVEITIERL